MVEELEVAPTFGTGSQAVQERRSGIEQDERRAVDGEAQSAPGFALGHDEQDDEPSDREQDAREVGETVDGFAQVALDPFGKMFFFGHGLV